MPRATVKVSPAWCIPRTRTSFQVICSAAFAPICLSLRLLQLAAQGGGFCFGGAQARNRFVIRLAKRQGVMRIRTFWIVAIGVAFSRRDDLPCRRYRLWRGGRFIIISSPILPRRFAIVSVAATWIEFACEYAAHGGYPFAARSRRSISAMMRAPAFTRSRRRSVGFHHLSAQGHIGGAKPSSRLR